jgi:hypothetical protein
MEKRGPNWWFSDSAFESRFSDFVKSIGGERVSEVIPDRPNTPRLADFLLWDRTVVAELKVITADQFSNPAIGEKFKKLMKGWAARGLAIPTRPGSTPNSSILSTDGIEFREQRQAFDVFCGPLLDDAADASVQIRSTKFHLRTPKAKGLLVIANLANRSLDRKMVIDVMRRVLSRHTNTIQSFAYFSPTIGGRLPNGEDAYLWIDGFAKAGNAIAAEQMRQLSRGWQKFNSLGPMYTAVSE